MRLTQIVANLVSNAPKYTRPGGVLEIEASPEGDEVVCRVRDDGVGRPPDKDAHIFDLFTRIEGREQMSRQRLGIGLALVRKLVDMHDGSVAANSAGPGRGIEFVIRLAACGQGRIDRHMAVEKPFWRLSPEGPGAD